MEKVGFSAHDSIPGGWERCGPAAQVSRDASIFFSKTHDEGPGTEQGLASTETYQGVELSFEVNIAQSACFIAKVFQAGPHDQTTNSYHLFCHSSNAYLARHNHVFQSVKMKRSRWQQIRLKCYDGKLEVEIDGALSAIAADETLAGGYCFLGVRYGKAWLRNLTVRRVSQPGNEIVWTQEPAIVPDTENLPGYQILLESERTALPKVSIITTVYDRVNCLADCLRSVNQLSFRDFEHIVVSDHPPDSVVEQILALIKAEAAGPVTYANLSARFNNWGIAPASVGLQLAHGRYVCFFSDDNGYTPEHFGPLVAALDADSELGFAYSSCQYAGRHVLRHAQPLPGGIDLGQPLFRKELFDRYLAGNLPFDMMAWDWHMIEAFMRHGVKWQHIDRPSFLFRLAACRRWVRA